MADGSSPEDELQRLRTRHALGEVTDEELAAAEQRLAEHQASGGQSASLTTRFQAMSRGELPPEPEAPAVDTTYWDPEVVATGAAPKKGPPVALIALIVVAVLVVILAAVLAA